MLWIRGIEIKENCQEDFHTITYLFEYASEDIAQIARQASISHLLVDLKNKYGSEILLIPIAGNIELESVQIIKDKYEISDLPAIIVDEKKVIKNEITLEELEDIVFERDSFEKLEGILFEKISYNQKEKIILNLNK